MKLVYLLSVILFSSCKTAENADFLVGQWKRTNEEAGKQTYEQWRKRNDSTYIGHSYTLNGTDTVWQENTVLSPIDGVWYLQVRLQGETQSTNFTVTKMDGQSFTCKNPQNEFPKVIAYRKAGKELHAEISGGGDSISFLFTPEK